MTERVTPLDTGAQNPVPGAGAIEGVRLRHSTTRPGWGTGRTCTASASRLRSRLLPHVRQSVPAHP